MKKNDWFAVDAEKRAARVRSYSLGHIVKELLANSLDADASEIAIDVQPAEGRRANREGLRAYRVTCTDNGCGCPDPELLRRIGYSTSDPHPEKRGRFGQGLIDVLCLAEEAEILTLGHRLIFDGEGYRASRVRQEVKGTIVQAILRHGGAGFEDLENYFGSVIVPENITFRFNGTRVAHRELMRTLAETKLQTVLYDEKRDVVRKLSRETSVDIYPQCGDAPMIYELGIPVDDAPWELPYDIDVRQKTPLDVERTMLPDKYKGDLIAQCVGPMSDVYVRHMRDTQTAPREIRDNRNNAERLSEPAKRVLVKTVTGVDQDRIVRQAPGEGDLCEAQELEANGYKPLNRAHLPEGVSEVLKDNPSVRQIHDEKFKVKTTPGELNPSEHQRACAKVFGQIASALLGKQISCSFIEGGCAGVYNNGEMSLSVDVAEFWTDPLGEETLGVILHECAHDQVTGHAAEFANELERLGGRLACWVADNRQRWSEFRTSLYDSTQEERK